MPAIEMKRDVQLSAAVVAPAALRILQEIQAGSKPFEQFLLHLRLQDAASVNLASVEVPVSVHAAAVGGYPPYEIDLSLAAREHKALFPRFEGKLLTHATADGFARIQLTGNYHAPLGLLGSMLDGTLLQGAAQRGLEEFMNALLTEVRRQIARVELESARFANHRQY